MNIYDKNANYSSLISYYAMSFNEFNMEFHTHSQCEIMYVVSGVCYIYVGSKKFRLSQKQFIFLNASVPHKLYISKGPSCSVLNLEFLCHEKPSDYSLLEIKKNSIIFQSFLSEPRDYIIKTDSGMLCYALKDFINYLEAPSLKDSYLMQVVFSRLLIEMANCLSNPSPGPSSLYLKKAKEYIHDHLEQTIHVQDIADYIGINHSYLQSLFSRYEDCSIVNYINSQRLEKSLFLLKNSQLSVIDIAFQVGYNSRQHFAHTFQKRFGISPKKYRLLYCQSLHTDTKRSQRVLTDQKYWTTNQLL